MNEVLKTIDRQYDIRAIRSANNLSALYVILSLVIAYKGELDDKVESMGKNKCQYKRWSQKMESEFTTFRNVLSEKIIESRLKDLAYDYDHLDANIRRWSNIEETTKYSFGKLTHTLGVLILCANKYADTFRGIVWKGDYYCRSLSQSAYYLMQVIRKYYDALTDVIEPIETPIHPQVLEIAIDQYCKIRPADDEATIRCDKDDTKSEEGKEQSA